MAEAAAYCTLDATLQPPPTSHDLDQLNYHISLQQFGERVHKAAEAAFPNDKWMRYTSVYVLILFWKDEDPNLPVSVEALELKDVFENVYHFNVETWDIPSEGIHKRVNQKMLDFVELGGDSKDDLKIVYYGGHGMLGSTRQSCWASRPRAEDPSFRTVKWSGIQHVLEEAESDVLLLFDCCSSGTANTHSGNGVTELIAACGFNASANPVGPDSFTRALITELRLLSIKPAFTVGVLFSRILCRLQTWMPLGREMQKPPLHVILSQDQRLPQSIQLSAKRIDRASGAKLNEQSPASSLTSMHPATEMRRPHPKRRRTGSTAPSKRRRTRNSSPKYLNSPSSTLSSQESTTEKVFEPSSSISSASSLSSPEDLGPRIGITIRLKETVAISEASSTLLADWVKMMPLLADHVKVEAGFRSFSTLLVLSLTIPLWCYLEEHPAISLIGIIRSSNLVTVSPGPPETQCTEDVPHDTYPVANLKPTPSSLGWGKHAAALIQLYKWGFWEGKQYFELKLGIKATDTTPKEVYLEVLIPRQPPYRCQFADQCSNTRQSTYINAESLALHYIFSHTSSEPKLDPSNGSKEPALSSQSNPNRELGFHRGPSPSAAMTRPVEAGASLLPVAHSAASTMDEAEEALQSEKLRERMPLALPTSLTAIANPDSGALLEQLARSEGVVKSHFISAAGIIFTYQIKQRSEKLLAEPAAVKALLTANPPSATSTKTLNKMHDSSIEKQLGCKQINASPSTSNWEIEIHRNCHDSAALTNSSSDMPSSSTKPRMSGYLMRKYDSNNSARTVDFGISSAGSGYCIASNFSSIDAAYTSSSTLPPLDSTTSSFQFHDPGYYSQSFEYQEHSPTPSFTRSTPRTLGWEPDSSLLGCYDFFAPEGGEPYWELRQGSDLTSETPQRVYLDHPEDIKKAEYPCQFPSITCSERQPFKRPADLKRHYQNVHVSAGSKYNFPCDYVHCVRHNTPFSRKDYYRNHLRDYHKEDIGRAQRHRTLTKKAWLGVQNNWIAQRKISPHWWRCSKCLSKVEIATNGFECHNCRFKCEEERRGRISAMSKGKGKDIEEDLLVHESGEARKIADPQVDDWLELPNG